MSFEEEFAILGAWRRQKTQEYDEALRKEGNKGLDSKYDVIRKQDIKEYHRRLVFLKVQYNWELDERDKELYERIKNQDEYLPVFTEYLADGRTEEEKVFWRDAEEARRKCQQIPTKNLIVSVLDRMCDYGSRKES
jgi:hypothetical protein